MKHIYIYIYIYTHTYTFIIYISNIKMCVYIYLYTINKPFRPIVTISDWLLCLLFKLAFFPKSLNGKHNPFLSALVKFCTSSVLWFIGGRTFPPELCCSWWQRWNGSDSTLAARDERRPRVFQRRKHCSLEGAINVS